jgi:cell wall-associated NlpC family hydrolase
MPRKHILLLASMLLGAVSSALGDGFLSAEAAVLQSNRYAYGASVVLPGEVSPLKLDCSNTARYLIQRTRGISLPRTASDQYLYIQHHGRLKRAGGFFGGTPDRSWWLKRLKPGDLLFWEHTYKPPRTPPVTHVMIYLGRDENGVPLMVGAQSSRGVGIYELKPQAAYGGHSGVLGLLRKKGKLVAYGRLP